MNLIGFAKQKGEKKKSLIMIKKNIYLFYAHLHKNTYLCNRNNCLFIRDVITNIKSSINIS